MNKLDGKTLDLVGDNIAKLKELFPEAFEEGKIDFEALKSILGGAVDASNERYSFNWHGKQNAIKMALKQSTGTLRPKKEESKNWDTTENLFIEGDNLEVLRVLQNSYRGKVKMIYIDPPYNTGHDFVYVDDYRNNVKNYINQAGETMKANPETGGRYHTNWLNMMYPRLRLSKNLLTDDGVIFLSIGDDEVTNLRKVCDEIFGEDNLAGCITRKTKLTSNKGTHFSPSHEYVLVYAKNILNLEEFSDAEAQEDEDYIKLFKYEDSRGKYNIVSLYMPSLDKRPNQRYYIDCPDGSKVIGKEGKMFRWTRETLLKNIADDRVVFTQTNTSPLLDENGNQAKWNVYTKLYLHERQEKGLRPITFFDRYPNSLASKELIKMDIPFDFSKPRPLIQYFMKICGLSKDSIILDFFAGSATTAHATMQLNYEDGGTRKFIMVQIPEATPEDSEARKAGFDTISKIGMERIRRAGKLIMDEDKGKLSATKVDTGFKVFALDETNLAEWDENSKDISKTLLDYTNNSVKQGRTQEDVLYEVLLKYGVDLATPIKELSVAGKKVYSLADNYLLVCLEKDLSLEVIKQIAELKPQRVVFYDDGFANDSVKANAEQTLKKNGVEDIRVI